MSEPVTLSTGISHDAVQSDIQNNFAPQPPEDGFCAPCFFKGLLKGALFGLGAVIAIALIPELAVVAAVVGVVGLIKLAVDWPTMDNKQRSEVAGELVGGLAVGGLAAGGRAAAGRAAAGRAAAGEAAAGEAAAGAIPKTYQRPSGFRKGVREKAWEAAKGEDGKVRDPVTGKEMNPNEPWDMGHKPGMEFRKHQQSAAERGIDRKQFLDEHNNPEHYRPELPSSNRSHRGEDLTDDYFGD